MKPSTSMRTSTGSGTSASPLFLPFLALLFSLWIVSFTPGSRATPVALVRRSPADALLAEREPAAAPALVEREPGFITVDDVTEGDSEKRDLEERGFITVDSEHGDPEELEKRTHFPDYPPSCQICEQNYDQIDSCANASIVFSDVASIMFDPLLFISVIDCACTDTFKSAYPQCVDCFEQTNQTVFLEPENGNLSSVVTGMRQICALGSSIFGHVASVNSELPGQTPITVASAGAAFHQYGPVGLISLLGRGGEGAGVLGVVVGTVLMGVGMGVWTVL